MNLPRRPAYPKRQLDELQQTGLTETLRPGATPGAAGPPVDLLRLEGDSQTQGIVTIICDGPRRTTVDLVVPATAELAVVGNVKWGALGGRAEATFDWIHGTRLTLPGSSIALSAQQEAASGSGGAPVRVGCFAGYLPYAGGRTAQRTVRIDSQLLLTGGSVEIPIADFARSVVVHTTPANFAFDLAFDDATGAERYRVSYSTQELRSRPPPAPLANDIRRVRFVNAGIGSVTVSIRAIWSLDL